MHQSRCYGELHLIYFVLYWQGVICTGHRSLLYSPTTVRLAGDINVTFIVTYWLSDIILAGFSSQNAKKWEVELQTLKNNNARLTAALQESTTNVDEWKKQLAAYKEDNARLKKMVGRWRLLRLWDGFHLASLYQFAVAGNENENASVLRYINWCIELSIVSCHCKSCFSVKWPLDTGWWHGIAGDWIGVLMVTLYSRWLSLSRVSRISSRRCRTCSRRWLVSWTNSALRRERSWARSALVPRLTRPNVNRQCLVSAGTARCVVYSWFLSGTWGSEIQGGSGVSAGGDKSETGDRSPGQLFTDRYSCRFTSMAVCLIVWFASLSPGVAKCQERFRRQVEGSNGWRGRSEARSVWWQVRNGSHPWPHKL